MNSAELRRLIAVTAGSAALVLVAIAIAVGLGESDGDSVTASPEEPEHPLIDQDHWHALYQIWVCDEEQSTAFQWEGGIHTHGDGIIHMHPFVPEEEGRGARLVKFFEYGGGLLTQTELRIPGTSQTLVNGLECPDGTPGRVHVFVNGEELQDWSEYIPQDGDQIIVLFGVAGPVAMAPVGDLLVAPV